MTIFPGCKCCGPPKPCNFTCHSKQSSQNFGRPEDYKCFPNDGTIPPYPWEPFGSGCYETAEECAQNCKPCWRRGKAILFCPPAATNSTLTVTGFDFEPGEEGFTLPVPIGAVMTSFHPENAGCLFRHQYNVADVNGASISLFSNDISGFTEQLDDSYRFEYFGLGSGSPGGVDYFIRGQGSRDLTAPNESFDLTYSLYRYDLANNQIFAGTYTMTLQFIGEEPLYVYECSFREDGPTGGPGGWVLDSAICYESEAECDAQPTTGGRTMPATKTGPGTELAALLKTIGIDAKEKGCQCKSHARRMDKEGPQWCRDNIETILGWLQTEAKKRKLPFIKTAAKQVVLLAIRRAEKKS